ncbi:hypothetical protein EYF80_063086 [Liparis tanakae]|uniref:Uncharacterized protein n=1 Tax=Liparis tanakae TaxID=230148 RepID=A0A4Z2ECZ3_9TELE|nr:hypothetical protein EYF80_063086 [Liparis tanakae]
MVYGLRAEVRTPAALEMTAALQTGLLLLLFVVACESEPTHAGPDKEAEPHGRSRLVHLTSHWAFQLANDSLTFSRAAGACRGQFSSLAALEDPEDQQGAVLTQQPLSSRAEASVLLDLSARALEDPHRGGLQPTDMVAILQLLSLAADAQPDHSRDPVQDPVQDPVRDPVRELSQNFISVADSLISEDSALKWQAIEEVPGSPCVALRGLVHGALRS